MPAINQRIPNFLGGVSQQPDTIKFPGQVRVCDNAVPDVTFGLTKRPAGEFVKTLTNTTADGYWYEIIRDGDKKYLLQITSANTYSGTKPIRIWNLLTGVEQTLTNSNGDSVFDYLIQTGTSEEYATSTIQDYTIITNPQKTITTTGTADAPLNNGEYAFARLDTIQYNTEYVLYTGSTPPTPNTYYRATALSVTKDSNSPSGNTDTGNTWDDADKDSPYVGLTQFSFGDANCENLEGHVTVNAASYVEKQRYNWDNGNTGEIDNDGNKTGTTTGSSEDFLGYTQIYRVRYTAQVTLKDGGIIKETTESAALAKSHSITIEGVNYTVHVDAVEEVETYEGVSGIAFYKTPRNPDEGSLSMTKIIRNLFVSVNSSLSNVTAEMIGSGLYLYGSAAPTVNFLGGAVSEQITVLGNTAQDVSRLPAQCKNGYVVQVANDDNTESDNYYLKFIADNGTQGSGKWEECLRPHNFSSNSDPMVLGLDPANMPHALINNLNGTFTFKVLTEANKGTTDNYWKNRDVGDDATNPFPSFNGKKIQKIFFHRNRLGFIANEQVVLSRPGDYFNFFIVSAISVTDDNPVDITVSDIKPAFINHVLPIQKGIMMFSDNGQFLLFTESDIFSPKTARLKKVASYETDASLTPNDLGTSVLFTSNVSAYTRAYEVTILDDDVPPQVIEQTRVVPEYLPRNITTVTNSTSLGIVTFGEKNSSQIYHYKYFNIGEKREQSAWYSWSLTGTMQHMTYTAGSFYIVTKQGSDYILCRHEYITDSTATRSYTVGGTEGNVGSPLYTARWFEACLDCMDVPTSITYTAQTTTTPEKTVLALNYTPTAATNFYAVGLNGTNAGMVIKADSVGTNSATFNGINMTGWEVVVGYSYTLSLELPDYHLALEANKYDTDGSLRISGLNFDLGVSGPMEFHLTAKNSYTDASGTVTPEFDTYIQYESGMKTGLANFGKPPTQLNKSVRVPIQKKNTKYNLQIKVPDPFSTALISASWDGNYNQRRHVRR